MSNDSKLSVVIDARPLSRPYSGIRRYLECVLTHLLRKNGVDWVLYTDYPLRMDIPKYDNVTIRIASNSKWARLNWFLSTRKWLKEDHPDIYWTPRHHLPGWLPNSVRKVVTIHDMVWLSHPETMRKNGLWAERLFTPRSMEAADTIITCSQNTADDICHFRQELVDKITVIRHGKLALPTPEKTVKLRNCNTNYFLSVGTIEPRKNYITLVQAYTQYRELGGTAKLVIAGNKGWGSKSFMKYLSGLKDNGNILIIENCSDAELAWLYSNALAFTQLSISEGYGLPIIEAYGYNLPMVLSDIKVFHEHDIDNVIWVKPHKVAEISYALSTVTQLKNRAKKKSAGHKTGSWEPVANSIYDQLLALKVK